jgi:hypothetical protein
LAKNAIAYDLAEARKNESAIKEAFASPTKVLAGIQTSLQNNSIGVMVEYSSNLILDGAARIRMAPAWSQAALPERSTCLTR